MVAIMAAYAVRPMIGDSDKAALIFGFVLMALLLLAVYNVNLDEAVNEGVVHSARARTRRVLAWSLAAAAGIERVFLSLMHNHSLEVVGTVFWLLFVLFVTGSELRSVLRQKHVTSETICMAVSVYLLAGFAWALLYIVMFERHPESFTGVGSLHAGASTGLPRAFPLFGYYSLGTLSTIGGGDITPVTLPARYATVAEAIMGQFYLAILVARLVSLQMSHSISQKSDHPIDR